MLEPFVDANGDLNSAAGFVIGSSISLIAVVITLWFGFLGTKRQIQAQNVQKVAEFRQKWIVELREHLAEFSSLTSDELVRRDEAQLDEVSRLIALIELHMNPKDENYKALQDSMTNCMRMTDAKHRDAGIEFLEISQRILKREWDELKRKVEANEI